MDVGSVVIVHSVAFPFMDGKQADTFMKLTITEKRDDVPGDYEPEKKYTGFKAIGEDGKTYQSNWEHYSQTSGDPYWSWWRDPEGMSDDEIKRVVREETVVWYDVTKATVPTSFKPVFVDKYSEYVKYCDKHGILFYDSCFYCDYMPNHDTKKMGVEENWKGWRE